MKALQLTKYGDVQTSVALRDIEEPLRADHQVLIKVRAAATNPIDWAIAEGRFKPIIKLSLPCTLGFDVSGEIVSTGRDVDGLTVGKRVFARVHEDDIGTFAEYAAVDAGTVAHMPANIGFREAAGLPLVGATVIQAFEKASLVPGDRVLIHAGSGGVGSFAIQYAKAMGAEVITTASAASAEWLKSLGADRVIDYKSEDYKDVVSELDIVIDTLGGDVTHGSFDVIKQGGRVMSLVGPVDADAAAVMGLNPVLRLILALRARPTIKKAREKSAHYSFIPMRPNRDHLDKIRSMVEAGSISPVLDEKRFGLSRAAEALQYQKSRRAKGKIVIDVA